MIKAIGTLAECTQYYWKKSRGKITAFLQFHYKCISFIGYILENMKARNEVKEDKRTRRTRRELTSRRRTSEDCVLFVPKRANFFK